MVSINKCTSIELVKNGKRILWQQNISPINPIFDLISVYLAYPPAKGLLLTSEL